MTHRARQHRLALVTGATGFIGSLVVAKLIQDGWAVRTLSRSRDKALGQPWGEAVVAEGRPAGAGQVEVVEGDAADRAVLDAALAGVDCAWYLLHSMDKGGGFADEEQRMARDFGAAAHAAGVGRIVYLGGLHPDTGELSEHLASRVRVGEILMGSGVPTAALQAGVVIGAGSLSFALLRHAGERVPFFAAPGWIANEITPVSSRDVVYYLVAAADLPAECNRTFDVGGPDTMKYVDMMVRYAKAKGLHTRPYLTAPVVTRKLASWGLGLLSPLGYDDIEPIFDSVSASTVVKERDLEQLVGTPDGGNLGFEEAVRRASRGVDARRYGKIATAVHLAVLAAAAAGAALTDTTSRRYRRLRKPSWRPPAAVFPLVWTALYTDLAVMGTLTTADAAERGEATTARSNAAALAANLALNVAWCATFFRASRPRAATAVAAALLASSTDMVRRAHREKPQRAWWLAPYPAWCGFATALTGQIARLNRRR